MVLVASADDARQAIDRAEPGDVITFVPGTYRFSGSYVDVRRPGAADAPIVVPAERAGSVVLEFDMVEGFLVSAPYWTFERLVIRGACADDSSCEHALHVVAGASHFVARENEVVDFNAQVNRVPFFGLSIFARPVPLILRGRDLTAREFEAFSSTDPRCKRLLARHSAECCEFDDAAHTFSTARWRDGVERVTVEWLEQNIVRGTDRTRPLD